MCSWAVSHYQKVSSCFSHLYNCFSIWQSSVSLYVPVLLVFRTSAVKWIISVLLLAAYLIPPHASEQQLLWATRFTLHDLCPLSAFSSLHNARAGMQHCLQEVTICYHVLRRPEGNAARPINRRRPLHFPPPELRFPAASLITLTLSQPGLLFPVESDGGAD